MKMPNSFKNSAIDTRSFGFENEVADHMECRVEFVLS